MSETANTKTSKLKEFTDWLFGGLNMSWKNVIIFSLIAAVVTAIVLIMPIFNNTSFRQLGVTLEAWIFFAVIIMSNCKTPLESAKKVFIFFLISQPLIYLLEVPFNSLGWGIFGFYGHWFILTVLTFPGAYIGWYITKKNWLSLLVLAPVMLFLSVTAIHCFRFTLSHFPYMLFRAFFCLAQVILYAIAFTDDLKKRLIALLVPLAVGVVYVFAVPQLDLNATVFLPDDPVIAETAEITVADPDIKVSFEQNEDSYTLVRVETKKYTETTFTITDGDKVYHYNMRIYENDSGAPQVDITEAE